MGLKKGGLKMSEIKFTAWVGKDVKIESIKDIMGLTVAAWPCKYLKSSWPEQQWPSYKIEITISTFISDGITEGEK